MDTTYDNQFDGESFEDIPDPNKKYHLNECRTVVGFTYLFKLLCLIDNNPELIDQLQYNIKNINDTIYSWTALHFVCWNYKSDVLPQVVKILIDAGIDVNAVDKYNRTALHSACINHRSNKSLEAIKLLIKAGVDVNIKNRGGRNALHDFCIHPKPDTFLETVQLLIDEHSDLDGYDTVDGTALYYLCTNIRSPKLEKAMQIFIKNGANPHFNVIIGAINIGLCREFAIYESIIKYNKHRPQKIRSFSELFSEEQKKLLVCFEQYKTGIICIKEQHDEFYYYPNNIGALVCESNFATSFNKSHCPNKLQFLFSSK